MHMHTKTCLDIYIYSQATILNRKENFLIYIKILYVYLIRKSLFFFVYVKIASPLASSGKLMSMFALPQKKKLPSVIIAWFTYLGQRLHQAGH
jgi:hypothetical protein